MIARPVCAPKVVANDAARPMASPTTIDETLSISTPPNASGASVPRSPRSPAPAHERARERPILLLEPLERRQDLAGDELVGGLPDQLVLVAQPLRREDGFGGLFNQPLPAADAVAVVVMDHRSLFNC